MPQQIDHSGRAALSICEALLLALWDRGVLPEQEARGVLRDAATVHENAVGSETEMAMYLAVARLINRMFISTTRSRRP